MFKLRSVDHRREAARQGERVGSLRSTDEPVVVSLVGGLIVELVGRVVIDWLRSATMESLPPVDRQVGAGESVEAGVMEPAPDEPHSVITAGDREAAPSSTGDPLEWLASLCMGSNNRAASSRFPIARGACNHGVLRPPPS